MTVERAFPSGGWRITSSTDDGYLFTRLYLGYAKREAIAAFRAELKEVNR